MRFCLIVCLLTAIVLGTSGLLAAQAPAAGSSPRLLRESPGFAASRYHDQVRR